MELALAVLLFIGIAAAIYWPKHIEKRDDPEHPDHPAHPDHWWNHIE